MKIYLLLLGLWISTAVVAQKPDIATRFKQKIEQGDKLFAQNHIKEAIQSYNVARVLAGTDNTKHKQVDACIEKVFVAIEKQKQEAISNAKKAKIATNDAKALYWSAEAGKINPIQGLRLLEEARKNASAMNSITAIEETTEHLFNKSNEHKWREKRRYENASKVTFSFDGRFLVTFNDGGAKVYELSSGKVVLDLSSHNDIDFVVFSSINLYVVTHLENGGEIVYELSTGKVVLDLSSKKDGESISFSYNDRFIIVESRDSGSKIFDALTGKVPVFLRKQTDIRGVTLDGDFIATSLKNGGVKVYDFSTGKIVFDWSSQTDIRDVSLNGDFIVTYFKNGGAKVYERCTDKIIFDLSSQTDIRDISFSSDKCFIASTVKSGGVKVYELSTGKIFFDLSKQSDINYASFSSNSRFLVVYTSNSLIKVYDIFTKRHPEFLSHFPDITYVSISSDQRFIVEKKIGTGAKIYDLDKEKVVLDLSNDTHIHDIHISHNGRLVFINTEEDVSGGKVYDILTEEAPTFLIKEGHIVTLSNFFFYVELEGRVKRIYNIYSNKSLIDLISTLEFKRLEYIETTVENGQPFISLSGGVGKLYTIDNYDCSVLLSGKGYIKANYSPNKKWLVTRDKEGGSKLWDVSSGREASFLSSEKGISDIDFSSDSKWLVTIKDEGGSKLWDVSSGKKASFLSSEKGINFIRFSSDSKWLVAKDTNDVYKL